MGNGFPTGAVGCNWRPTVVMSRGTKLMLFRPNSCIGMHQTRVWLCGCRHCPTCWRLSAAGGLHGHEGEADERHSEDVADLLCEGEGHEDLSEALCTQQGGGQGGRQGVREGERSETTIAAATDTLGEPVRMFYQQAGCFRFGLFLRPRWKGNLMWCRTSRRCVPRWPKQRRLAVPLRQKLFKESWRLSAAQLLV